MYKGNARIDVDIVRCSTNCIPDNMSKNGSIILIEDDADDQEIFTEAITHIGVKNELICFSTAIEAFEFLTRTTSQPFLIFCDVNLPMQTGIEFKRQVDQDPELRKRSIPFIFYSTSVDERSVTEAYTQMTIQGFFRKESTYPGIISRLKIILDYWYGCEHPSNF